MSLVTLSRLFRGRLQKGIFSHLIVSSLGWKVVKNTKSGWKVISNSIKGKEPTQINLVIIHNCSDRSSISDRKEHREIIDLEIRGPSRQPRQNQVTTCPPPKKKIEELLYSVCHCLNQLGKFC